MTADGGHNTLRSLITSHRLAAFEHSGEQVASILAVAFVGHSYNRDPSLDLLHGSDSEQLLPQWRRLPRLPAARALHKDRVVKASENSPRVLPMEGAR